MDKTEITSTYRDVVITYNEGKDRWEFTLRGVERFASTLGKAKEAIDKPPKTGAKAFVRIQAYYIPWSSKSQIAEITSLLPKPTYGEQDAWITIKDGRSPNRVKSRVSNLFPVNNHNTAVVKEYDKAIDKIEAMQNARDDIKKRLQAYEGTSDGGEGEE